MRPAAHPLLLSCAAFVAASLVAAPAAARDDWPMFPPASESRLHLFLAAGPAMPPLFSFDQARVGWDLTAGGDLPLDDAFRLVARLRVDSQGAEPLALGDGRRVAGDSQRAVLITLGGRRQQGRGRVLIYQETAFGLGWGTRSVYAYDRDEHDVNTRLGFAYAFTGGVWFETEDSPVAGFVEIEMCGTGGNASTLFIPLRLGIAFSR